MANVTFMQVAIFCGWRMSLPLLVLNVAMGPSVVQASDAASNGTVPPGTAADGIWLRPAADRSSKPVWGFVNGIQIGLHPLPGPRGLLRVYAPFLDHEAGRVINFIAIEPIVRGDTERGFSELEFSRLDKTIGKRLWSADDPHASPPGYTIVPSRGQITTINGIQCLQTYVLSEPFDNGAHVYLRMTFSADRPHEVGLATFAFDDSKPLDNCIVTATMGNYARLRRINLAQKTVTPEDLWPDFRGDGFTPHARFALDELTRTREGHVIATLTPDETRPNTASHAVGTPSHWCYRGKVASQSWRSNSPDAHLEVRVNGRHKYWNSKSPIPGGVSYENFEMVAPFQSGEEFWFGVDPISNRDHCTAVMPKG